MKINKILFNILIHDGISYHPAMRLLFSLYNSQNNLKSANTKKLISNIKDQSLVLIR
jgi:hypothetical protein